MTGIADLPRLVYLDEPQVSQPMQLVNQGKIEEIVEEYGESDSSTKTGGLNIYNVVRFELTNSAGSTENTAKTIQNTPLGQFAVYHGLLEDSNDLENLNEITKDSWETVKDGAFVTVSGKIIPTPLNKMVGKFDEYGVWDDGDEDIAEYLRGGENYYQIKMENDLNGSFIFRLDSDYLLPTASDFPEKYSEYTIFGTVKHAYEPNQRKEFMGILDDVPSKDREARRQVRMLLKAFSSNEVADLLGQDIHESDYYISHPDIELSPIAVYL